MKHQGEFFVHISQFISSMFDSYPLFFLQNADFRRGSSTYFFRLPCGCVSILPNKKGCCGSCRLDFSGVESE